MSAQIGKPVIWPPPTDSELITRRIEALTGALHELGVIQSGANVVFEVSETTIEHCMDSIAESIARLADNELKNEIIGPKDT